MDTNPLASYQLAPLHREIAEKQPDAETIRTRAELEAIADTILTDSVERRFWEILHNPIEWRSTLAGMAQRAGLEDYRNVNLSARVADIFGRMEKASGIPRARSIELFTGFTADRIKAGISTLMDSEDEKIQVKAHELASKVAGMQFAGRGDVTVNVAVQVNVRDVDPLVASCIEDDEDDSD